MSRCTRGKIARAALAAARGTVARVAGVLLVLAAAGGCGGKPALRAQLPPPPDIPPFAEVVKLDAESALSGAQAEGTAGDWIIRNERLAVVVRGLQNLGGFTYSGGNIIDAAPAGGEDLLAEVFTLFDNTFARQAVYDRLEPEEGPGVEGAVLTAQGRDSEDAALEVTTRYTLLPASNFLSIETRLTNMGTDTLADFELGDAIEWGRAVSFAPGPGRRLAGHTGPVPFLVGASTGTAYGWIGADGPVDGPHSNAWSDPVVKTVTLGPGESASYSRRLFVVPGPAQNAIRVLRAQGSEPTGEVTITVKDGKGHPVAGAQVQAVAAGLVQGWGESDTQGVVVLSLPAGTFHLEADHPHNGAAAGDVALKAGETASVTLSMAVPARLHLEAEDGPGFPSPARWIFQGIDTTPDPDFGPAFAFPGAGRNIFTPTGTGETLLPPGSYRVTACRGPGYTSETFDLEIGSGKTKTLRARLDRLVPRGWVSADLHVHALPSPDCGVTLQDRVRSLACEGVEWFAASDHHRRTDYGRIPDTLALAAPVRVIASEEITTDHLGHFGALPLPLHPEQPGGGPIPVYKMGVDDLFSRIRDENPDVLIQVNHPRGGSNGYFTCVGDPFPTDSTPAAPRLDFDLLEIVNGKHQATFDRNWKDWMDLLASGRRIVGVGNSDSHFMVGQEVGYPRNYVLVDSAFVPDEDAVMDALARGRVVVTNGPFIEFTLEGKPVGSRVASARGRVTGHIRVVAPSWVDVKRVIVYANGVEEAVFLVKGRDRTVRFDEDFDLHLKHSGFVVVKVEGDESLAPILPPLDPAIPLLPLAFTNPVWVGVDGTVR